jgi:hypothetical protein
MTNAPSPDNEKGRVVPFRRRAPPPVVSGSNGPVEDVGKYARPEEPDNYRQRMINNVLALTFCVVLVGIGVWLANTMAQMRKSEDCVMSGRRDCATIAPPASPR